MIERREVTATDVAKSINGYDELAIARAFGKDVDELRGTMAIRAVVFLQLRREGVKDAEAKRGCMELTVTELNEFFAEEEPDADLQDEDPKA